MFFVGFPFFLLLWTIYYVISVVLFPWFINLVCDLLVLLCFPSNSIFIFFLILILWCTFIALYSQHIPSPIYMAVSSPDFLLSSKSIHAWCTAHTLYHPSTDSFPLSAESSLSLLSFICNFIMIITPSNIYYHHLCG